jgi:hypothetical protein
MPPDLQAMDPNDGERRLDSSPAVLQQCRQALETPS